MGGPYQQTCCDKDSKAATKAFYRLRQSFRQSASPRTFEKTGDSRRRWLLPEKIGKMLESS